jgi:phage replication initiation protein
MKFPFPESTQTPSVGNRVDGDAQRPSGGVDPRLVIRGESITTPPVKHATSFSNQLTLIDFLGFTYFPEELPNEDFPLKSLLVNIFNIPAQDWKQAKTGWQGYENRIILDGHGLVAFGGVSQKKSIHVELSGTGCAQVKDWLLVHDWFVTTDSRITRIDLAHDDFTGRTINIRKAITWSEEGLFNSSGRPPNRHLRDDFDSGEGKTFYVGKRGNDKFTRIYEKGKKAGDPNSLWCRAEVEFRARDKTIPNDIFINPDIYFSGAYKAFSFLSLEQSRFVSQQKEKDISLEKTKQWARSACGQFINLLCLLHKEDHEKVISELRRAGIPKALSPLFKRHLREQGLLP